MAWLKRFFATPRSIGISYIATLLAFAAVYYLMPDSYFYHATIQYEPATSEHKKELEKSLDGEFRIDQFSVGPHKLTVTSNQAHGFMYTPGVLTFKVGYYYYSFTDTIDQWAALERDCGKSEKPAGLYKRSIELGLTMSPSSGGSRITVRAKPEQPLGGCDKEILQSLYKSFETTDSGFQAMIDTTPQTQSLLIAVTEEQLGNAPRQFWLDRAIRMFYLSVAIITTTGFGDIVPLSPLARVATALEAVGGIVLAGAL